MNRFDTDGYVVCGYDPQVAAWAQAARGVALHIAADPDLKRQWLRHQATWFVGVDVLPNAPDGSIAGKPLCGTWDAQVQVPKHWHAAQVSVVYPGYPKQETGESDASHRFRRVRFAAHVDGILLDGGRRYMREPHSFVLGLPLNESTACPLMVWPESHRLIGPALSAAIGDHDPATVDITEVYKAIRAEVFARIEPVALRANPGEALVLHRHLLHGIAPWAAGDSAPPEGRMVAYFRPRFDDPRDWLT